MEFGDELILDSFKVPWLIWIQLVVMFLLFVFFFFGVTLLTSDAVPSPSPPLLSGAAADSNSLIKDEDVAEGEGIGDYLVTEEDKDGDESPPSPKDPVVLQVFRGQLHPCSYMKAIFKCFGFDSSSRNSHKKRRDKRD